MPGDAIRWMTYQELAAALRIGSDSARNLVRRMRWARRNGNDGMARIGVPVEHLETHAGGGSDGPTDAPTITPIDPPISPPVDEATITALEADLGTLQAEVLRLTAINETGRIELEQEQGRADALTQGVAEVWGVLAAMTAAQDAETVRGGQVAVLEAVLDLERQRVAEARAEAEKWREAALAPRGLAANLMRLRRPSAA